MEAPRTVSQAVSAAEWNEVRFIQRVLTATAHYAESKLGGHTVDVQCQGYGKPLPTSWRMVLTVQYVKPGPPVKIVPSTEIDGRL
jgi:hypothetical protein